MNARAARRMAIGSLFVLALIALLGGAWPGSAHDAGLPAAQLVLGDTTAVARWFALATRTVLGIVAAATVAAALFGTLLGTLTVFVGAGGGLLSRLVELSSSVPLLILVGIWRLWDSSGGLWSLLGALALLRSLEVAELVRARVLATLSGDFIEASRALGATRRWQLRNHVAPRVVRPLLVNLCAGAVSLIGLEAALGFTGLGLPSHVPSWGGGLATLATAGQFAPLGCVVFGIAATAGAFHALGMSLAQPAPFHE
jgi:oligopeptide transport system permease protein